MANIFQGITLLSSPPMAAAGLLGPDLVLEFSAKMGKIILDCITISKFIFGMYGRVWPLF